MFTTMFTRCSIKTTLTQHYMSIFSFLIYTFNYFNAYLMLILILHFCSTFQVQLKQADILYILKNRK